MNFAEECHKQALEVYVEYNKEKIDRIKDLIRESAASGVFALELNQKLEFQIQNYFESLGFKIENNNKICW